MNIPSMKGPYHFTVLATVEVSFLYMGAAFAVHWEAPI